MIDSNRIAGLLICVAAWAPSGASAQPHQVTDGQYTLRGSAVSSESLPESMAEAHGFAKRA